MNSSVYAKAGIALSLAVVCTSFWLSMSDGEVEESLQPKGLVQDQMTKPIVENKASAVPMRIPGIDKKEGGHDFSDDLKQKIQLISDAYEEQIKYPSYSVPIEPEQLANKYISNVSVANELPADLSDPNSPLLSVKPNKLRYYFGDSLTAEVKITGLPDYEQSSVSARLISKGDTVAYAKVTPSDQFSHAYSLEFSDLHISGVEWKQNLTIDAEFQFLGESHTQATSVEYHATIAAIDDVAPSQVQGEFLQIPVYIYTEKAGYHRISGNLYDSNTGEALIHLRAEDYLESSNGSLVLKAHISALKAAGSEGPYELKDISLKRMPSPPEFITEYGRVDQHAYQVDGYGFGEYTDTPYVNEKTQRIAKELRRLGS